MQQQELNPDLAIEDAAMPVDLAAEDGTGTPPETLRAVLRAIHRLRLRGQGTTYAEIQRATAIQHPPKGLGRMTVSRAVQVLSRESVNLIFRDRQREGGKQAANHYAIHWQKLADLCRDEALALFARGYGGQRERAVEADELSTVAAELSTVGRGQSTVAGELSPVTVLPRAESRGGKGGHCASANTASEEQEQESSSCSSLAAAESRGSTARSNSAGETVAESIDSSPAGWQRARERLIECGVYAGLLAGLVRDAERNGAKPGDIMELCRCFRENPDGLDLNAGALKVAVENWRPRMAYNAAGLWPQVKLPPLPADGPAKSSRELADDYEHRRNCQVRQRRKEGWPTEQINAELQQLGFEPIAAGPLIRGLLPRARDRPQTGKNGECVPGNDRPLRPPKRGETEDIEA